MEYLENNEIYLGNNIDDVYQALQEYKKQGQKYQVQFNGKVLNCDMTLDHCYQLRMQLVRNSYMNELNQKLPSIQG